MLVDTILLDAGGVLVWPNWTRIAAALRRRGVAVDASTLSEADPHARHALDVADVVSVSTDGQRSRDYFTMVLTRAGVTPSEATDDALAERRRGPTHRRNTCSADW